MKFQVSILCLFLCSIVFYSGAAASETLKSPDLAILYTGDGEGNIVLTGRCCSKMGGIARRATKIKEFKEKYGNVIIVDTGDYLSKDYNDKLYHLQLEHIRKSLITIGYDAVNIADNEIASKEAFLKYFRTKPAVPIVGSNVIFPNKEQNICKPYIIKKTGDLKIGIIGLVSPDLLTKTPEDKFIISDPVKTIKKYLPEIRTKADIIILLSHTGWQSSIQIARNFSDIDVIIVGHDKYPTFTPETIGKTLIVKNEAGGGLLGIIEVWADQSKKVKKMESRLEILSSKIEPLPEYAKLEKDFIYQKNIFNRKLKEEEAILKKEKAKKEAAKYLKLTPEEFIEQMKKENRILKTDIN